MHRKLSHSIAAFTLLVLTFTLVPSDAFAWRFSERADFSNVVFVGDSLTAGFQNGSLYFQDDDIFIQNGGLPKEGQVKGYAAQLADQAEFDLTLPLVTLPGIPGRLVIDEKSLEISQLPGTGYRWNPKVQATNLAVPGHTVRDALSRLPGDASITTVILGFPGIYQNKILSQVEWAKELEPTFVFLWIGNNDFLGFATSGGVDPITPFEEFESDYEDVLERLQHTGADMVVANIPDVTSIPFFFSAEAVAEMTPFPLSVIGPILGISSGDFVTLAGLPLVEEKLSLGLPLPDHVVLNKTELDQVRNAVNRANRFIAREAAMRNIPLVDINLLFKIVEITGVPANGEYLTTAFLGGLFTLDGVHPTNTGYAVIANHFIRTLNRRYRARIPRIKIGNVAADDPLVIPELLPDTRDVLRELLKGRFGDGMGPIRSVLSGNYELNK